MTDEKTQFPSAEAIRALVSQSAGQLEVRKRELDIQEKNIDKGYDYACRALDAQSEDLKNSRVHERKQSITKYVFVSLLVLLAATAVIIMLKMNKDAMVLAIMKFGGSFLAGGASGYGVASYKKKGATGADQADPEPDSSN